MALLETCTAQWQDPRDMLQTSAWRSSHGNSSQHVLFPAIAHELQTACQLYAQVWHLLIDCLKRQSLLCSYRVLPGHANRCS